MTDLPRPIWHLQNMMLRYPHLPTDVDRFRAGKGTDLPDWPDWCLLPMAAWMAIVTNGAAITVPSPRDVKAMGLLAAIGTWRYSQGIYVVDPDLRAALTETDITGDLPGDVLLRLPEWSVYISTLGMAYGGAELYGFWAHLENDVKTGDVELRLLLDQDEDLTPIVIHLGDWPLVEAVQRTVDEANLNLRRLGSSESLPIGTAGRVADQITPLVSILLYLCSDEPEIDAYRTPGTSPGNPAPKKTKRGVRLFAPNQPRMWIVGEPLGNVIRESRELGRNEANRKRAHIRRGHWHGYWLGPRNGERRFSYRWLPPMLVSGDLEIEN